MMTVPMDNLSAPSSRELVQRLYKKNIELENKRRKSAQAKIPTDPNAWQQMRENYEAIILEDHAFTQQYEIEYALWQLHYRRIEELRAHLSAALASAGSATSQVTKSPAKPDRIKRIRSQFKTFLSEATGFYHDLILKIRARYGLPLGHLSEDPDNHALPEKDGKKHSEVKKGLMSCHRCLIYLGDLARYKGLYGEGDSKTRDYAAASSYYMQASSLWPSSGNPHHQLAILASYSGDELVAIYRYFRSLAVNSPFSTARDNLIIAFEKNRQSYSQLPGDVKASLEKTVPVKKSGKGRAKGERVLLQQDTKVEAPSIKERTVSIQEIFKAFCIRFVRFNGILFTRTSLETFAEVFSLVRSDLHELLSSGPEEELNFGTDAIESGLVIVRLVAVLIFTVHNMNRETEGQSYADILQRSVLLQNAFTAAFQFMGHIVERCIQLQDPSSSYLLPSILVFVEWLACRPEIAMCNDMEEKQSIARSFFWTNCTSFLNKLISSKLVSFAADDEDETCFSNMSRYDEGETDNRLALWEDVELRGFVPLLPAQVILDFSRKHSVGGDGCNKEKKARVQRILAAGRALTGVVRIDQKAIHFDQKLKKFAIGIGSSMSEGFMHTTSPEKNKSNGMSQETPAEHMRIAAVVPPKAHISVMPPKVQLYLEGEEEDEEIVFKPTISEKLDVSAPKLTPYEVFGSGENTSNGEWASSCVGSVSAPLSNFSLSSAMESNRQIPASFTNVSLQHLPPIPSGDSNWLAEQHAHLADGMKNLCVPGNGFVRNTELKEGLGYSQPPAVSLPFQQSTNFNLISGNMYFDQTKTPEIVIPSKFDSVMFSGANGESQILKPSPALQSNARKNPVSRPVRHLGPPPGFSHVQSKPVDDPMGGSDLKNENSPLDDYTWLDGYQATSSAEVMVPTSVNHIPHVYQPVMNSSSGLMAGPTNFPFPGKQVPALQVQVENEKNWQDRQLLEHLKLYQEQQHLQLANQQSALLPEHYQGQSMWSNHFFV